MLDPDDVTLPCEHRVVGGSRGAELLVAFKRFVEQWVLSRDLHCRPWATVRVVGSQ
jgi:hypothetical protein